MRKLNILVAIIFFGNFLAIGAPEISIKANNQNINSGDTIQFGNVLIGNSTDIEVTIKNDGDTLVFNNFPFSSFGNFSVVSQPSNDSLIGLDSTTFTIRYDASCASSGVQTGSLTISNNDPNESNFVLRLKGFPQDIVAPVARCTGAIQLYLGIGGSVNLNAVEVDSSSSDNCSIASRSLDKSSFDCSDLGFNAIELTITDVGGNTAACNSIVEVLDTTPPTANCANATVYLNASGTGTVTSATINNNSTDNCGITSLSINQSSFDCSDIGINNVTLTVRDAQNNVSTCGALVTVEDTISPTPICSNLTAFLNTAGQVSIDSSAINNGSTDNCAVASFDIDEKDFDCSEIATNNTTLSVTDQSGNTNSCLSTVTIEDTISPIAICKDTTIFLSGLGTASIPNAARLDNGSTDACGIASFSTSLLVFDCSHVGNVQDTLLVTDVNGNSSTCISQITIEDTITPQITCPGNIERCESQVISYAIPAGLDNCTGFTVSQTGGLGSGSLFPVGTTTETYTITDASGNSNSCAFDITVFEQPTTADAGLDQEICIDNTTLSANAPVVGTGFWTKINGTAQFDDSLSATTDLTSIPVLDPSFTTRYAWSIQNGVCPVSRDTIEIRRDAEPSNANAGGDQLFCNIVNANLFGNTPAVGSGSWALIRGNSNILDPSNPFSPVEVLSSDTNTFVWTISNGVCTPSTDTAIIRNDLFPTNADAGTNNTICRSFDTLRANVPLIGTGQWTTANGFGIFADNLNANTVVSSLAETDNQFVWTITNGVCPSQRDTVTINRSVQPVAEAGPRQTVCFDSTTMQATVPAIGTGTWFVLTGASDIADENDPVSLVDNLNDGENTFLWIVISGACTSQDFVVIEKRDNLSEADAGPDQQICADTFAFMDAVIPSQGTGTWGLVSGSANIDNISFAESVIRTIGVGFNTFTWTISSPGCESIVDTIVIARDGIDPEISCPNDITISNDLGDCGAIVNYTAPVGTDNCPGVNTFLVSGFAPDSFFPEGTTTVEYEAIDSLGFSASCSFDVTVEDIEDPVITCVDSITNTNTLGVCGRAVNYPVPNTSDNCGILSLTQTDGSGLTSGDLFPIGFTTQTYEAVDSSGNTASCSIVIEIIDNEPPSIICPNDTVYDIALGSCEAFINYADPIASDNCPGVGTLIQSGLSSGSNFPPGVTTNTFIARDASGLISGCSFTVTVNDDEDPVITCPIDISVDNDPGICGADVSYDAPVAFDLCNDFEVTQLSGLSSGSTFPLGLTTNRFLITDQSGNTDTCTFTVTVNDIEDPEITCPSDIVQNASLDLCEATVNFAGPIVTDNCSGLNAVRTDLTGLNSGDAFQVGVTTLSYTATDTAGNTASCTFDITVIDDQDPSVACPNDTTIDSDINVCGARFVYLVPIGDDNCGIASTLQSDITGLSTNDTFPIGTTIQTWTTTDNAGNTASCSFEVEVIDANTPTIVCPSDTIVGNAPGSCNAIVNYDLPQGTDLCSNTSLSLVNGQSSGSTFNAGINTVTYRLEDEAGNFAECSFNITVIDTTSPQINPIGDITVSNDSSLCSAVVVFNGPTATDNCNEATVSQVTGPISGSTFPAGATQIGFIARDTSGNISDTLFVDVVVNDDESPIITCPDSINIDSETGICGARVNYATPIGTDNCGIQTLIQSDLSGLTINDTFPIGTTIQTWTVNDDAGNTTSCSFEVNVRDANSPFIVCPNDTTVSTSLGSCGSTVNYNQPIDGDSCTSTVLSLIAGSPSGSLFSAGINTITYQTVDEGGNTATCSFDVTVEDNEAPVLLSVNNVIVEADTNQCQARVTFPSPTGVDNCDSVRVSQVVGSASGSIFPVGTSQIGFIAQDSSGNSSDTLFFDVIVNDTELPEILCPSDLTVNSDPNICGALVSYITPSGTDNCGITSILQTDNSGLSLNDTFPIGTTLQTWEVVDNSGNEALCNFNIEVIDINNPEIVCPNDTTVNTIIGNCSTVLTYDVPVGTDLCSSISTTLVSGLNSGAVFELGTTEIIYEVEDAAGNTAQCSFDVTVIDGEAPEIISLGDIIVSNDTNACNAVVTFALPVTNDNCDDSSSIVQVFGPSSGSTFPLGTTLIAFLATDSSGNVSDTSYVNVTVEDNQNPVINCPSNIEICDSGVVNYANPTFNDNCTGVTLSMTNGLGSGAFYDFGTYTETYEAEDAAGNISTCSFQITVFDTIAVPYAGTDTAICSDRIRLSVDSTGFSTGYWEIVTGTGMVADSSIENSLVRELSVGENVLVWVSSFGGCTSKSDTVVITRDEQPESVALPVDTLLCSVDPFDFSVDPLTVGTGAWSLRNGIGTITSNTTNAVSISSFRIGTDTLVFTISNGSCTAIEQEMIINYSEIPLLSISSDTSMYCGESMNLMVDVLNSSPSPEYSWSPMLAIDDAFASNPVVNPMEDITYSVLVTDALGCSSEDSVRIDILDGIRAYTGITPNGDNVNDVWIIRGTDKFPNATYEVYTQWGQKVFESTGYDEPWDATNESGNPVPFGVYYYVIDKKDGSEPEPGTVTVIK